MEVVKKTLSVISILLLCWTTVASTVVLLRIEPVTAPTRPQIVASVDENAMISEYIKIGKEAQVYDFYNAIIGNRQLTYLIISNALINDIPVNYFVSLAYTESRFHINAVGKNVSSDGSVWSYDYGVFQLNSKTFSTCTREYLMDIENNVRLAATHLSGLHTKYNNWYEALLSYNAGNTEVIKNITVKHFISVLSMNNDLNTKFLNMEF